MQPVLPAQCAAMGLKRLPPEDRPPQDEVVAEIVLGPCQRPGDPERDTDWWEEQHVACTGSEHLAPYKVVRCVCPCHSDPTSQEALDREQYTAARNAISIAMEHHA